MIAKPFVSVEKGSKLKKQKFVIENCRKNWLKVKKSAKDFD
jgi:flagellar biosynthesis chaperone FliJ